MLGGIVTIRCDWDFKDVFLFNDISKPQSPLQGLHVFFEFFVDDFGVVLGSGNAFVTEHFGYAFYGHSVAEGDSGCKGVARNVKGEVFVYVAVNSDFLKG